jgi:hypothetical protein
MPLDRAGHCVLPRSRATSHASGSISSHPSVGSNRSATFLIFWDGLSRRSGMERRGRSTAARPSARGGQAIQERLGPGMPVVAVLTGSAEARPPCRRSQPRGSIGCGCDPIGPEKRAARRSATPPRNKRTPRVPMQLSRAPAGAYGLRRADRSRGNLRCHPQRGDISKTRPAWSRAGLCARAPHRAGTVAPRPSRPEARRIPKAVLARLGRRGGAGSAAFLCRARVSPRGDRTIGNRVKSCRRQALLG